MSNEKFMYNCFLCRDSFQFGPGLYDGKTIPLYGGITVCMGCYKWNWDGWNPEHEDKLISHLNEKGLPIPERNEKGWLPRGE
ncbi:hypothetical protein [Shewanella surugensis]|uniref:Uncharacterized protein n=1 Tax=Shewanella surugensis TaxID=212020 RepID=A0ABT0LLF1_9GAMM|nr:hypothetical protein [Shewanella surugensis]MCL1127986.1 hypothetical protein [Shewanella surugensis]